MKKSLAQPLFLLLLMAGCLFFADRVANPKAYIRYIWADAEGYYMYLPAVFVFKSDFDKIPVRTEVHFGPYPGTNKIFTKYNYGVALMQSPFFLGAYALRMVKGQNPKAYVTYHYDRSILWAACFYGVLGLWLIWKSLARIFQDKKVLWFTLAAVFLGTNLLYYMTRAPGMSHAYSFFLLSALVYLTPGLFHQPNPKKYLLGGFVAGLMVLIRPTNGLLLLYPFLYGINAWGGFKERMIFIGKNWGKMAVAAVVALALWLPQMAYWHYLSGDWFMDAYSTESFKFWNRPLFHYVLFSYLNGYFIYNPILLFPVAALFFMLKKNHLNSWAVFLIFWLSAYVFSSWWCWWFGGSYGHRCFVELLPMLAFPMAFLFQKIWETKYNWLKISGLFLAALLVFYNFRMTMLYDWKWSDMDMNWEKYWDAFAKAFFF